MAISIQVDFVSRPDSEFDACKFFLILLNEGMNEHMNDKMKPALIGGAILFVLGILTSLSTAVLPQAVAGLVGCCNCLWPIGGGLIATYLYIQNSSRPVQVGEGAVLGALAGVFGGILNLIIGTPIAYLISRDQMAQVAEQFRQAGVGVPEGLIGLPLLIAAGLVGVVMYTVLATIGGLIGVPVFEKRKDGGAGMPPPPPPSFGGQPGSGYTSPGAGA